MLVGCGQAEGKSLEGVHVDRQPVPVVQAELLSKQWRMRTLQAASQPWRMRMVGGGAHREGVFASEPQGMFVLVRVG